MDNHPTTRKGAGIRSSDERDIGNLDWVIVPIARLERKEQRRRSARRADHMLHADALGEGTLKLLDDGAVPVERTPYRMSLPIPVAVASKRLNWAAVLCALNATSRP